jgi:hypothetical protein
MTELHPTPPRYPNDAPLVVFNKWKDSPQWPVAINCASRMVRDASGYAAFTRAEAVTIAFKILGKLSLTEEEIVLVVRRLSE